ncbi:ADP-ribosyl glycohydrolase [Podospora fimiseda]|uniref:ADP-ribosylhydrolase ARH3 n=1 Tax=Podospora fimiseda TaxID=252190 RepID=A0AAN7BYT3_9PEZI|nr:ADP-ribosyl glycohydrolase [Podospora fimiseda]
MAQGALATKEDRVIGALLGVHAGDCLGAAHEFLPWANFRASYRNGVRELMAGGGFGWKRGEATDDTDMTRAVLLAYYDHVRYSRDAAANNPDRGKDVAGRAASYFLDWFTGNNWPGRTQGAPPRDVGNQTQTALMALAADPNRDHTRWGVNEGVGKRTAGNGGLMRCIPIALFNDVPNVVEDETIAINNITHLDSESAIACVAYNLIVSSLVNGMAAGAAYDNAMLVVDSWINENRRNSYKHRAAVKIKRLMEAGRHSISLADFANNGPERANGWKEFMPGNGNGYVGDSLLIAIAALFDTRSLEDILVDVVRLGKDTDTNAAIAGGILGARDGQAAIPERWKEHLQYREEFQAAAEYILEASGLPSEAIEG